MGKLVDNLANLLLHLKFDCLDMVLNGHEVLFFFLLPLQQPFNSFHCRNSLKNIFGDLAIPFEATAHFCDSARQLQDAEFMAIVLFLIAVGVAAELAEEGVSLAVDVRADVGDGLLGVLGAA